MGEDVKEANEEKEKEKERENEEGSFEVKDKRSSQPEEGGEDDEDPKREEEEEKEPPVPTYVELLQNKLAENEKQLKEYIAAYKQKMEENEGFRKRLEESFNTRLDHAKGDVVQSLLPVVDNLDRAISAAEHGGDTKTFLDGIIMVRKLFVEQLKGVGLEEIDSVGKSFDPNFEEAIAMETVTDKEKDGLIIEEFQKGFRLGDRLLRPAKVKVGKYSSQ